MCRCAHLTPQAVVFDIVEERLKCSDCRRAIKIGTPFIECQGGLDDGTERICILSYHPECWAMIDSTIDGTGCFSYGKPTRVELSSKTAKTIKQLTATN